MRSRLAPTCALIAYLVLLTSVIAGFSIAAQVDAHHHHPTGERNTPNIVRPDRLDPAGPATTTTTAPGGE